MLIVCLPMTALCGIRWDAERSIKALFTDSVKLTLKKITIKAELKKKVESRVRQRFFKPWLYVWEITKANGARAWAVLDNVRGKAQPISFMAVFDSSGVIRSGTIIKYRESVGGAVQNKNWLAQFTGRSGNSGFTVGRDIDAISGATISVHAVTRGMHKLSLIFSFIRKAFYEQ